MASKLIRLADKTLVQIEVTGDQTVPLSGGLAETVDATIDKIKPVLLKVCRPVVAAVKELHNDVDLTRVEVEVGLSFDIQGNIYVAKTNFGANILVRMTLKEN